MERFFTRVLNNTRFKLEVLYFVRMLRGFLWVAFTKWCAECELVVHRLTLFLVVLAVRAKCRSLSLVDVCVVDRPQRSKRFYVKYALLGMNTGVRLSVSTLCDTKFGLISLTGLLNGIQWVEREIWDMFGIFFYYNLDLRRILTDYGFVGHPLQKDFPLTGFYEVSFDEVAGSVLSTRLELAQSYRMFRLSTEE